MQSPDKITARSEGVLAGQNAVTDQVPPEVAVIAPDVPPPVLDANGYRTSPDQTQKGWPAGVPFIVGNEACERFSFYGMRAILFVHLVSLYAAEVVRKLAGGAVPADPGMMAGNVVAAPAMPDVAAGPMGAVASLLSGPAAANAVEISRASNASATSTVHLFIAGVYALPMIGALMADRWAGKYRTILYLSLIYCLGHAVLSGGENFLWGMYLGLALIAVGSGGIKPCVSANVGDQFGKANWGKVRTVYQIFYFSINFGSFFATLLIPFLKDSSGYWLVEWFPSLFGHLPPENLGVSVAFGVPGVLMFLATFIFWLGRRKFVHVPANPGGKVGLLDTVCSVSLFMSLGHLFLTPHLLHGEFFEEHALLRYGVLTLVSLAFLGVGLVLFFRRQAVQADDGFLAVLLHVVKTHLGMGGGGTSRAAAEAPAISQADTALAKSWFWRPALERFGLKTTEGPVAVFKIISIFFLVTVFWALFDQHSSTWIRQAGEMNLAGLKPSQIPAANPLMVMVLIPIMNLVYHLFDRIGLKTTPLRRITVGMFITASSFVVTALLQQAIDNSPPRTIHVGWQMIQYLLITIGEVMVSVTGLEFAYTQAPKKMKSTVMGFWLLTVTLGNVLVAYLAGVQGPMTKWVSENVIKGLSETATFFWVFAVLSGAAAAIFGLRAMFYQPKDFAQE